MAAKPNGFERRLGDVFEQQRKRVEQQSRADIQGQSEGLKRRFASLGQSSSGAAIKAQQTAQKEAIGRRQQALEGINVAETRELGERERQDRLVGEQREFQSGEALKQREFAGGEALKGREFQAGQSDIDRAFRQNVFAFEKESKLKTLDLAQEQFDLDKITTEFNKALAAAELDDPEALEEALQFLRTGRAPRGTSFTQPNKTDPFTGRPLTENQFDNPFGR